MRYRGAAVKAAMPPKRVLVLEDEYLIAETLREDLESLGVGVMGPAADCSAALELLWRERPDLAILDTHLGSETCEVVLEECRAQAIPVVIFSGHIPADLPAFASGLPAIPKPYLIDQLSRALAANGGGQV